MFLSNILSDFIEIDKKYDCILSGLALDSRKVKPGDLFFACKGVNDDGTKYIDAAIENGAVAILSDTVEDRHACPDARSVPIFYYPDLHKIIGNVAAKFYGYPAEKMTIIGVTGTNGKTSITQFIAKALGMFGKKCGIIGTIGVGFPDELVNTGLTTPDAITVQSTLFDFLKEGAEAVAIEASSHSLVQNRLQSVSFKIGIFTNLTRDHLDYHRTFDEYFLAKKILFQFPSLEHALINIDDEYGRKLITSLPKNITAIGYSASGNTLKNNNFPLIQTSNIKILPNGFELNVLTPWGEGELHSTLLGRFNIDNLLAVLGALCVMGFDFNAVVKTLEKLTTVRGRMEALGGGAKPLVVIDYAHTPDALLKALLSLREHCHGKLICVFGCGGDRDRGKRPIMGEMAERYSDYFIITNDNPRTEDEKQIMHDILAGLSSPNLAHIEYDREKAINFAIKSANAGDVVLIAGKGHEDYQILGKEKIHFDDVEKSVIALQIHQ